MNNTMNVYAVHDRCVGFGTPMLEVNHEIAKRNFAYACNQGQMKEQASDFDLYFLGVYDITSGMFTQDSIPALVISGPDAQKLF